MGARGRQSAEQKYNAAAEMAKLRAGYHRFGEHDGE